jgi:hypothetical protein
MQVLAWERRAEALAPAGMVTRGELTRQLLGRLVAASEAELARLSVVATRDLLVLIGASDELPWIDGARYCAPEPLVPSLWLPTTMVPAMPLDLVRRSAAPRVGTQSVLLWNEPELLLPLHEQRSLTPFLRDWFKGQAR